MAIRQRRPGPGLIHHSDQGSQYTDSRYQAVLVAHGIQASMNGVGNWYDNAPMMTDFTRKSQTMDSTIVRLWQHIPVVVRAIVIGFVVTEIGVGAWLGIATLITAP